MKIIKEPLHIDFEVENRPLTKEEEVKISQYINSQNRKKELIKGNKPKVKLKEKSEK